jgi:hypothetical protein
MTTSPTLIMNSHCILAGGMSKKGSLYQRIQRLWNIEMAKHTD